MDGFLIFGSITALVPTILHLFGLILLLISKFNHADKTQRLYFMMLSSGEAIISFYWVLLYNLSDLKDILSQQLDVISFIGLFGCMVTYEAMIFMTLDRFFSIFLNIKYPLYWKYGHTEKLVIALTLVNSLLCLTIWLTKVRRQDIELWFYLTFDILFLITATFTYTYVFIKIKQNQKIKSSISQQQQGQSTTSSLNSNRTNYRRPKKQSRQLFSVFLLVITFFIFTVISDFCLFYIHITDHKIQIWQFTTLSTSYSISNTCDFLIYTFSTKPIKKILRRLRKRSDR